MFERLFGSLDENPADRRQRLRNEISILDYVSDDTRRLTNQLGPSDHRKIDEYLTSVREIERRIQLAEKDDRANYAVVRKTHRRPGRFRRLCQIDVRSHAGGFPNRHHARLNLHDRAAKAACAPIAKLEFPMPIIPSRITPAIRN